MEAGQVFGRWTVIEPYEGTKQEVLRAKAVCQCGTVRQVNKNNLKYGLTKSCGCLQKEKAADAQKIHGMTESTTYNRWAAMKRKCQTPKDCGYPSHGGKGITVCSRWQEFSKFYEDMGNCNGLTLGRVDTSKNFEPGNCIWVTSASGKLYTIGGHTRSLKEWCDIYQVNYNVVERRINLLGWDLPRALTQPKRIFTKR